MIYCLKMWQPPPRFKTTKLMLQKIFNAHPNIYCKSKKHTWLYGRLLEREVPSMWINLRRESLIRSSSVVKITIPQFLSLTTSWFWRKIKTIQLEKLENQQSRKHLCWNSSFKSLLHPYLKAWLNHQLF